MIDVPVQLNDRSYRISIGAGVLASAGDRMAALVRSRRVAIVTDETVAKLHLDRLIAVKSTYDPTSLFTNEQGIPVRA